MISQVYTPQYFSGFALFYGYINHLLPSFIFLEGHREQYIQAVQTNARLFGQYLDEKGLTNTVCK